MGKLNHGLEIRRVRGLPEGWYCSVSLSECELHVSLICENDLHNFPYVFYVSIKNFNRRD